jgi:hypothetical protein
MHLIEILLPLLDNQKRPFARAIFKDVELLLTEKFSGFTAFDRSPAKGITESSGKRQCDDIVVFEVMVDEIDRDWWKKYRAELEARFQQDEVVIRAHAVERL